MREHRHARFASARARRGPCRRAARSRRSCRRVRRSISPTAARSRVGTSWIASSGKSGFAQARSQCGMDRARGAEGFRAAAQDRGVAGLEAKRAGIGGHVRPAFVDDADRRRAARARARWSCRSAASSIRLTWPTGSGKPRTISMPSAMAVDPAVVEHRGGRGKRRWRSSASASATSSGIGGKDAPRPACGRHWPWPRARHFSGRQAQREQRARPPGRPGRCHA